MAGVRSESQVTWMTSEEPWDGPLVAAAGSIHIAFYANSLHSMDGWPLLARQAAVRARPPPRTVRVPSGWIDMRASAVGSFDLNNGVKHACVTL